jgi:hypothetical protein
LATIGQLVVAFFYARRFSRMALPLPRRGRHVFAGTINHPTAASAR